MADFKNVVVLGDSMSDIGNKWTWPTGELGRLFGAMRVNKTGRFSDGKNWTDFLVEWSTGTALMAGNRDWAIHTSSDHRTLQRFAVLEVAAWEKPVAAKDPIKLDAYLAEMNRPKPPAPPLPEIGYVNYAMGGAIVTTDWAPKFGALTYLREQVEDYVSQRGDLGKPLSGPTLHVVWIGLNDFVTAERPDYDAAKLKTLPATADYAAWRTWSQTHPKDLAGGVGVFPAVAEIQSLVELVNAKFPAAKNDHHFLVIDLPSVYNAIRYMEGLGEPKKVAQAQFIDPVIRRYNAMLESLVGNWPAGPDAPAPGHVQFVKMSAWMDHISQNLETWKLSKLAQDKGVPVFYNPGLPGEPAKDPAPDMRRRITTSDLGHPTEAVYELMARYVVSELLHNGHTLGRLTTADWPRHAPFPGLPFGLPG